MDKQLLDIYAHMNLHEALLAINLANIFRDMPNGQAQPPFCRSEEEAQRSTGAPC